jgi:hypothetical protein
MDAEICNMKLVGKALTRGEFLKLPLHRAADFGHRSVHTYRPAVKKDWRTSGGWRLASMRKDSRNEIQRQEDAHEFIALGGSFGQPLL